LLPVLEALLGQFPFVIHGFHSDNGSEFINYNVARLLEKLLIEQTQSRAHHCGDNGLVVAKNGAIIRKHIGYGYIDAQHAAAMDQFHRDACWTSLAGFGSSAAAGTGPISPPESGDTPLAGFETGLESADVSPVDSAGGRRPQPRGGPTAMPAAFR
jgi:hypothetical protein